MNYSKNGNELISEALIDAVSSAVYASAGDSADIYGEESVVQGASLPAYFISITSQLQKRMNRRRYLSENKLLVTYYPEHSGDFKAMRAAAELLFDSLEFITLKNGDILSASSMSADFLTSSLSFNVTYSVFFTKPDNSSPMESLELGVRGE